MRVKDLNKMKKPIVKVDNSLKKLNDKVLFDRKLNEANKILKRVGLPK